MGEEDLLAANWLQWEIEPHHLAYLPRERAGGVHHHPCGYGASIGLHTTDTLFVLQNVGDLGADQETRIGAFSEPLSRLVGGEPAVPLTEGARYHSVGQIGETRPCLVAGQKLRVGHTQLVMLLYGCLHVIDHVGIIGDE